VLRGSSLLGRKFGVVFPRVLYFGSLLFFIFIKDLEDYTSGNVLKFADDTKIFREVRDVQDSICMQADLERLVEWADING